MSTSHPNREQLRAYLLGDLPAETLDVIGSHLETCPDCETTVEALDSVADTLVTHLAAPKPEPEYTDETGFRRAMEFVREIGFEPSLPVAAEAAVPAPLGRLREYELLEKLGEGGMGAVYKAMHTKLDKVVALKVLPRDKTASPQAVARFEREMKAVGKLDHPNLIRAHDAGEVDGTHFLVMEYVAGVDLAALVKAHGQLYLPDACELVRQAAVGLQSAHEHGLVHRDIKPSNLMLTTKGQVKILDLGLALLQGQAGVGGELTGSGQMMGTIDYMAPEQGGDSHQVDVRADLYSLSATLYKLLTGTAPLAGAKYDTLISKLMALATETHVPLGESRKDVPAKLATLVDRLLAKKPADRPATPAEVVDSLAPFCAGHQLLRLSQTAAGGAPHAEPDTGSHLSAPSTDTHPSAPAVVAAVEDSLSATANYPRRDAGRTRPPRWLIATAAAGGVAAVLLGIIVIVRNREGKEVGRIESPDAASVEVRELATSSAQPATLSPRDTPSSAEGSAPPVAIAPFDAQQARAHQEAWAKHLGTTVETTNSVGAKMVLIPPGEFLMGSTNEQLEAAVLKAAEEIGAKSGVISQIEKAELPQHKVVITKPLLMSATEVTIGQFKKFAAATSYQTEAEKAVADAKAAPPVEAGQPPPKPVPSYLSFTYLNPDYAVTDDSPAAVITWNDAVAYCKWLSDQEKTTYRLPTEAEWEYACRAGTTTQYSFGDDYKELPKYAWHSRNITRGSHPVGTKLPNPFGLFDMHGNLQEWCGDYFDDRFYFISPLNDPNGPSVGSDRVIRGGSWLRFASYCRSAYRISSTPSNRLYYYGFRCVSVLDVQVVAATSSVVPVVPPVVTPAVRPMPVGPQPPPTAAPFDAKTARSHQDAWAKHLGVKVETPNSVGQTMILIPPGEFLMGSADEQVEAKLKAAEEQHKVVITKPLLMSATEVTIGQFKKFAAATSYQTEAEKAEAATKAAPPPVEAGQSPPKPIQTYINPGYVASDDLPAAFITWNDAVAYCKWLSEQEKTTYRLPTEAEWEYACRAGTITKYSFGVDELRKYGWYDSNAAGKSHPVGTKLPNGFGLFDMHGNLYEWCGDYFDEKWYSTSPLNDPNGPAVGSHRVVRGGSWFSGVFPCRSAYRLHYPPSYRSEINGFRCLCVLDVQAGR